MPPSGSSGRRRLCFLLLGQSATTTNSSVRRVMGRRAGLVMHETVPIPGEEKLEIGRIVIIDYLNLGVVSSQMILLRRV